MIAAGLLLLSFYTCAQTSDDIDEYSDLVHLLTGETKQHKPQEKQKVVSFGDYGEEVLSTSIVGEYDVEVVSTLDFLNANLSEHTNVPNTFFYNTFDYDLPREEITPELRKEDLAKFQLPVQGYLTSQYGFRAIYNRVHRGVDLKLNVGDTVYAALPGRVKALAYNKGGYGYFVVITHANGLETLYGHLSGFIARKGDYVSAGEPIALGGSTGRSTGPHLHFEMRYNGRAFDPNLVYNFNLRSLRYMTKNTVDIIRTGAATTNTTGSKMPPMLMDQTESNVKTTPAIPSLTDEKVVKKTTKKKVIKKKIIRKKKK